MSGVSRIRIALGAAGVLLGLFGVFRLLTEIKPGDLEMLAVWLIGALVIHDGILAPTVAGLGWVLARTVPPRARRHLQPTLVIAGLITIIALPMIYLQGSQPASKGILRQDYTANLGIVLGIAVAIMLIAYVVRIVRDGPHRNSEPRNSEPRNSEPRNSSQRNSAAERDE